jgi:hypothetical protein
MPKPEEFVLPRPQGGINTRSYPTELSEGEFVMLKNLDPFGNLGAFVTRKGTDTWNTTLPVTAPIRGGFRFYFGTSRRQLIVVADTTVYYKEGAAGDFSTLLAGVTANRDWTFASYLDHCYMANGVDTMKRWNGTTARAAGFPAPASAPSVATGAAGVLTGAYSYKVSAVYDSNSAHESSVYATASATVNPSSQKVELTNIPTITNATARNIYRTEAGGSVYYYLATINDNVTTTYSDNTADASLSTTTAPVDNGIPPAGQYVLFWRGRMIVANTASQPQRVFFSSITTTEASPGGGTTSHGADAEIFPSSHYLDVGDDNAPITGLAVLQDQLVVFKEDQIWNISGDEALEFRTWRAQSTVGCIAPKTIVNMRGTLLFLGRNDGSSCVYSYDGSSAEEMSLPLETTLNENIYALGDKASQPIQPCATRYRGSYILCYRKVGGSTFETAVLDTRPPRPRWMIWDKIEASCFIPFNGPGDAGEMYYGSQEEARVLRLDTRLTDYDATDPTPVECTIETGWMDFSRPHVLKQINWIDIYGREGDEPGAPGEPDPGVTTITVERLYDFDFAGSTVGCDEVDVTAADKHMDRQLWKHRIHCEASEGEVPELCYRMKLLITTTAPIEIHRIVVNYTANTSEDSHGQE